jgi:DNA polymerase-3 subunit epsilon
MTSSLAYDGLIEAMEQTGEFRVLRRFEPRESYGYVDKPLVGLFVDVEGTGLNADEDAIIQFAAVQFEFDRAGNVGRILSTFDGLEDPGVPLEPEVVDITGLTDDDLRGQKINDAGVAAILGDVELVIAHNAEYDRHMIERRFPGFDTVPWACSQRDVTWETFGCRYIGLEFLLMKACGEFFAPHDALDDCRVGLHVLAAPRAFDRSPFSMLVHSVQQPTLRLYAWDSPYSTKDRLRLRRFRWDAGVKCWRKDLKPAELEREHAWLLKNVYNGDEDWASQASVTKISALDRYSSRA